MWFAYASVCVYFIAFFRSFVSGQLRRRCKISISNFHYFELRICISVRLCVKVLMPHSFHFFHFSQSPSRNSLLSPHSLLLAWQVRIFSDAGSHSLQTNYLTEKNKNKNKTQPNIFDAIFFKSIQIPFHVHTFFISFHSLLKCRIAKIVPLDGIFTLVRTHQIKMYTHKK